jgi:hypothetical protein
MKGSIFILVVLALGLAGSGPAWSAVQDQVLVHLPYSVAVGNRVLPPGEYLIKPLETAGGHAVWFIFGDHGRRHEATLTAIPAVSRQTPSQTEVVLDRLDKDEYVLDQMWIEGQKDGYHFILPERLKAHTREHASTGGE